MAKAAPKPWTLDEFLAFDDGSDTRYELLQGEIFAMTPPTRSHVILCGRLARAIGNSLEPACEVGTEAGVVVPDKADSWYQADLVVTCAPGAPDDPFIAEPLLVIEVLSPSTAANDYLRKLPDYRSIPSVRDILLVSSTEPIVEHWHRTEDGWQVRDLRVDDAVRLDQLGIVMGLRELYDRVLPTDSSDDASP